MNQRFRAGFFALLGATFFGVVRGEEAKWQIHVDLIDGSRVVGTTASEVLEVDAQLGRVPIPLNRIRAAAWGGDGGVIRLTLDNDDLISGKLVGPHLRLATLFGEVDLQMKHITGIQVWPAAQAGVLPADREGLALFYMFDRAAEGAVINRAGRLHNGVLTGARWIDDGRRGGGVAFDGASRIEIPHHPELCPPALTVGAWIKPTGNQANYQVIIAKTDPSSWQGGYGLVRMPRDAKNVYFFINGYTAQVAKAEVPNDKWSHVAGVCDGKRVSLFVNGKRANSVEMVPIKDQERRLPNGREGRPPAAGAKIDHSTAPLWIGSDTSGYAWRGKMDEVFVYGRALAAEEMQQLYESAAEKR